VILFDLSLREGWDAALALRKRVGLHRSNVCRLDDDHIIVEILEEPATAGDST
jgi:hypothetical protein